MATAVLAVVLQTATPTPGVGPGELVDYWPFVVRAGWFFVGFLGVVLLGWYVVGPVLSRVVRRRNRNNPTVRDAIRRYFRLLVAVVGVFVGAGVAGYGQFLTDSALVVAAGTLAIGVAGQTVIGSLISGLVLVADPEFNVGDYIEWEDGEGTIRSITLRVTRVQTPDGKLVTIPNTVLTGQAIIRPFGQNRYRVVERVDIDYEDDVDEAVRHLESAAIEHDDILAAPDPVAYVDDFGDDAVVVCVHYWIENPDLRGIAEIRSAYARAVKARLEAADITISPASARDLQGRIGVDERA